MELSREHYKTQDKGQGQLAVFDLIGELLAVTLEKHDIDVVIDSAGFLKSSAGEADDINMVKTMVDCEDVVETKEMLEITLSGAIQKNRGLHESFMLIFSVSWDKGSQFYCKQAKVKGYGTNKLWLQFSRKTEQLTDSMFRVHLYREELSGKRIDLGEGKGFLVFGREKSSHVN